jgi:hypothetical protein
MFSNPFLSSLPFLRRLSFPERSLFFMNHIEEATTTLAFQALAPLVQQGDAEALATHPCMVLLRQAVELVARRHGGSVTTTYTTYYGEPRQTNTGLALQVPGKLPRGIGLLINVQTGALIFQGDPWDYWAFFAEVQQQIVQTYIVLAHGAALRRMHAQVSTQTLDDHRVVITGVLHG